MQKYIDTVAVKNGARQLTPLVGGTVTVTTLEGAAAEIFDANGGLPRSSPLLTDINGAFSFYAVDGRYTITITGNGIVPITISDVLLEDPVDGAFVIVDGAIVEAKIGAGAVTTPKIIDGAVTAGKLADNAVTTAKIIANAVTAAKLADDAVTNTKVAAGAAIDSAKLAFLQAGTGAVIRSLQDEMRERVSVKQFGVVGDGAADDTVNLQKALAETRANGAPVNAGKALLWKKGTYKVTGPLTVGTDQFVIFEPGVVIDATGLPNEFTSVFNASNQSNVYFDGNGAVILGSSATAAPAVEGNSAAFFIYGTDNCYIKNFQIQDFATDGITIDGDNTGSGPCTNVVIENVVALGSRRNGLSIISVKGCTVIGGEYATSSGSPFGPWAGIDVEPNENCFIENVLLLNVRTRDNIGSGIQITTGALSTAIAASNNFDVTIVGGGSLRDGLYSANRAGLLFANGSAQVNRVYGQVNVRDFQVDNPIGRGVAFFNWDADKAPRVVLDGVSVYDPDSLLAAPTNLDRSGFVISCETGHAITNLGNIEIRNCRAIDRRAVPQMTWGMVVNADASKVIKNVTFVDPLSFNIAAGAKTDVHTLVCDGAGTATGLDIIYTKPTPNSLASSAAIGQYAGKRLNVTVSASAQTLPLAANCDGAHYEIQNAPGVTNTTVTPQSADTILWLANTSNLGVVLGAGGYISLRSRGGNSWVAEAVAGQVWQAGTSAPGRIYWGTAAPVSGTYSQGDRTLNISPAVGSPKEWICTVSGTPGTWVSAGNL